MTNGNALVISDEPQENAPLPKTLEAIFTYKVNLAQQQNEIPFLKSLKFYNNQEYALENIVIKLASDPLFLEEKEWHVERINAGQSVSPKNKDVSLSRKYLAECQEAVRGTVILTVEANGEVLDKTEHTVLILAPDEWGGMDHLPELTAAFCRPNDPVIDKVLKDAAIILKKSGKNVSLDGYQSKDRNSVYMQVSAIYNAITKLGLDYSNPPASFEYVGQKVRMPGRILESGLATCFDLTLFMAACLEQCGLNPLLVFTKGHSFVGCWLIEEDFSTSVVSDPQAIRKRQQLGELTLIETTLLTQSPVPSLKTAIEVAKNKLDEEDLFECAVDIHRSRMGHIRPLMDNNSAPSGLHNKVPGNQDNYVTSAGAEIEELDTIYEIDVSTETSESLTTSARIEQWKHRLLDLTKRNPLLNFKSTKKSIPIYSHNPAELEDKLAADQKLKLVSMPKLMGGSDPRSAELFEERHNKDAQKEYAKLALSKKDLLIKLEEEEMGLRLVDLYRAARHDLEEGGANTLFIAIGFLHWKESELSDKVWKAPLILIPVVLERKSVQAGFKLVMRDDEPIFNPTLIEMLQADFQISIPLLEGELPKDNSGLDIPKILQILRAAIRDIKGWEVTEEVVLSTFSFSKYLMWKDLQDNEELLKENPVVKHLIDTPQEPYRDQGSFPEVSSLDKKYHPQETFCPLSADAYQMAAVYAASEGKDFVLVGPPGTGKSQTITNMVVQLMAMGKTVLFVSEKMAALDVVYRRLRDIGLADFCLELHSSKANKKDVLMQLGTAWNSAERAVEDVWQKEADKLATLREKLNEYPERLHCTYRNGLSPHKALGRIITDKNMPFVSLSWSTTDAHSEDDLESIRELTKRLVVRVSEAGVIKDHPFTAISKGDWSPIWQDDFQKSAQELMSACQSLRAQRDSLTETLSLTNPLSSNKQINGLLLLSKQLLLLDKRPIAFAFLSKGGDICNDLEKAVIHGRSWLEQSSLLSQKYTDNGVGVNDKDLSEQWSAAENSWWLKAISLRYSVQKAMKQASSGAEKPDPSCVQGDLSAIALMKSEAESLDELSGECPELGKLWQGVKTDWTAIEGIIAWARKTSEVLPQLAGDNIESLLQLRQKLHLLVSEGQDLLVDNGTINQNLMSYIEAFERYNKASDSLNSLVTADLKKDDNLTGDVLLSIEVAIQGWLDNLVKLKNWCSWRSLRDEAISKELFPLIEAIEAGSVSPNEIPNVFEHSYRKWWVTHIVSGDPVLRDFVGAEHERLIDDFKTTDDSYTKMTHKYIRTKLSGGMPVRNSSSAQSRGTEWGMLNRQLEMKRPSKSLRSLLSELPNALTKLTPCLLMSPMSIAQYLSAGGRKFDVVIFDEASQIPVWDAIGAIARGSQTIIVGDPKQLPPTAFFSKKSNNDDDDDDDDDLMKDMESILDECKAARIPTHQLNMHYRSRHESLITFSNHKYYGGKLVTFPSPVTKDSAVSYHHVPDGVYEKGVRVNRLEARAVVRKVVEWLTDAEFNKKKWTIGIVTFNQTQQKLIEDLLDVERRKNQKLEYHFSTERIEPVFVKNIENVQGDERDIIIFSLTYGPDAAGKLSMRFGAINNDGGERRLNVAITRARNALQVFGKLQAHDIDLSRAKGKGLVDFKHFLEFAERGHQALAEAMSIPSGEMDSVFEEQVAAALIEKGWAVHAQIGVSGYRIDLAVVNPDAQGSYLAGVECDGATYHSSATARDRDKLREGVLRGLGWEILRIWSTDWWYDAEKCTNAIDEKLKQILFNDRNKAHDDEAKDAVLVIEEDGAEIEIDTNINDNGCIEVKESDIPFYITSKPREIVNNIIPDDFHEMSENQNIQKMVEHVVSTEGPVALELLANRISRAYGFKKTGRRILERVSKFTTNFKSTKEGEQIFIWPEGTSQDSYKLFRITREGISPTRTAEQITLIELNLLAEYIRITDFPVDRTQHIKQMADYLGYKRVTEKMRDRLMKALELKIK